MTEILFLLNVITAIFGLFLALIKVPRQINYTWSVILIIAQSVVIGLRDINWGQDTKEYVSLFLGESHFTESIEPLFLLFLAGIRLFTDRVDVFLVFYALCLNVLIFTFFCRILGTRALLAFAFFAATHAYWLVHVQVMRNGLAAVLFLLATSLIITQQKRLGILLGLLSVGIHYSIALVAAHVYTTWQLRSLSPKSAAIAAFTVLFIYLAIIYVVPSIGAFEAWVIKVDAYDYYANAVFATSTIGFQHVFLFFIIPAFFYARKLLADSVKAYFFIYISIVILSAIMSSNILYRDRIFLNAQILEPLLLMGILRALIGKRHALILLFVFLVPYAALVIFFWGRRNILV